MPTDGTEQPDATPTDPTVDAGPGSAAASETGDDQADTVRAERVPRIPIDLVGGTSIGAAG